MIIVQKRHSRDKTSFGWKGKDVSKPRCPLPSETSAIGSTNAVAATVFILKIYYLFALVSVVYTDQML
jgi:hypothetical protein